MFRFPPLTMRRLRARARDAEQAATAPVHAPAKRTGTGASWLPAAGECILCVLAILALGAYFYVAWFRLQYPFSLEWCESGIANRGLRVLQGLPLYTPPSPEYTCYQYTPLHAYLCAVSFLLFGAGLPAARFVSFLCFLGTIATIYLIIRRETGRRAWGFIGAGLFTALCDGVSCWFDLVRVDMPQLFFFLVAVCVARFAKPTARNAAAVGLLLFLSFFAKQSTFLMAIPMLAYWIRIHRRNGITATAVFAALCAVSTAILNYLSDGWYLFYTYTLLRQHNRASIFWKGFWQVDLWGLLPIASLVALLFILTLVFQKRSKRDAFYPAVMAGALLSSWLARLHEGGAVNSTLPAHAILVIIFAIAMHAALRMAFRFRMHFGMGLSVGLYALCVMQFCMLAYDPRIWCRPESDTEDGWKLVDMIRQVDGEVFIPNHGCLARLAGKKCYSDGVSTWDVLRGKDANLQTKLSAQLKEALQSGRFAVVILDNKKGYADFMGKSFTEIPKPIFDDPHAFMQRDRWDSRPMYVFVHKKALKNEDIFKKKLPIR